MKIIAISGSAIPSTTANSVQTMKAVQALAALGHEVSLIVPLDNSRTKEREWSFLSEHYGLEKEFLITFLPCSSRKLFFYTAVRHAKKQNPDLLYVWPIQTAVLGLLFDISVVLEMHDLPSGRGGPFWFRYFRDLKGKKAVSVITKALHELLIDNYGKGVSDLNAVIAPNGVELERFAKLPAPPEARQQLGLKQEKTVLCAGHLYKGRGGELFLELARNFQNQGVQFLWVGGNKKDIEHWRLEAAGLENVVFAGFVPNAQLPLYQAAAEILIMPYGTSISISSGMGNSERISSPMKMFEYLATGRPIISSDLPVFREVLNKENAVLCPPDDAESWTREINRLLVDTDACERYSTAALISAQNYSWVERARKILKAAE
ncbi:MAG TPA: glycosyltransferase [Anaerolineales bacterium]|nr:glycosyltransferase [Anaerolineales bacterium]